MGTHGYFAYRYKGKYYRRWLPFNAYLCGYGQLFADAIPRDPAALKEWINEKIEMLESAELSEEEVMHDSQLGNVGDDTMGYNLYEDSDFTFPWYDFKHTYVIDLDNLAFTIRGETHLKLDNMPPSDPGLESYLVEDSDDETIEIPSEYLNTTVNLWPPPDFNVEERQRKYEALSPLVVPAAEWGAWTWEKLSMSQRLSIDLVHHLVSWTSHKMECAYAPSIQKKAGQFCWEILRASMSSLPYFCDDFQAYSGGQNITLTSRCGRYIPFRLRYITDRCTTTFKEFKEGFNCGYCWVRGCLVAFCIRLGEQAYVVHEIEQMVQKMRHDGKAECVGVILSSQQEMIAVAVDNGLEPTRKVRHTPVLGLRPNPDRPGQASDGLLLLVHLLSPSLTIPKLPWRIHQCRQLSEPLTWSRSKLPLEVLQRILWDTDTHDYTSLSRVSRLVRSVYLANPRFGNHTLLYRIPGRELAYATRHGGANRNLVLDLYWCDDYRFGPSWKAQVYSLEEYKSLNNNLEIVGTRADEEDGEAH